jgi:flagellar motor component MotA
MKRYLLSLLVLTAGLVYAAIVEGGNLLRFLDLPSFLITVIIPFLFVTILFGFKETHRVFAIIRKNENDHDTLLKALKFFNVYSKATWVSAIIAVITATVGILLNLENKSVIGPHMAFAFVTLLYCGMVQLAIILPYKVSIHKQLGNSRIRGDMFSLFGSLFGVIAVYLLIFIIMIPV